MPFATGTERRRLEALAALADANPFLPDRIRWERRALGRRFVRSAPVWHADADLGRLHPNLARLREALEELLPRLRGRLLRGVEAGEEDLLAYEAAVRHLLYLQHEGTWLDLAWEAAAGRPTTRPVSAYARFERDVRHWLELPERRLPVAVDPAHLFAWGFQIRRAFHHTFRQIHGGSLPAARLRAAVWQSIFTHDPARYRRALYDRMAEIPTLVVGESGTGKELVAQAIALSRFIAFDPQSRSFRDEYGDAFRAVNLAALSPTLIESELFGHARGAFTGAVADRAGWLETCGAEGTVFLDEIGELDPGIQVKLLRLLQTRGFQRIGETAERRFAGKFVAATHRDLPAELEAGRFRRDFYYRLCADVVETPTLREQLAEAPEDLHNLAVILARRIAGPDEAEALAAQVEAFVQRELGRDYPWPGNVRELEQCVRNVLVRGAYRPAAADPTGDPSLARALARGELSAEALLRRYCTGVYARTGSYVETARRLGLDRRTVRAKVDRRLLARLRRAGA